MFEQFSVIRGHGIVQSPVHGCMEWWEYDSGRGAAFGFFGGAVLDRSDTAGDRIHLTSVGLLLCAAGTGLGAAAIGLVIACFLG